MPLMPMLGWAENQLFCLEHSSKRDVMALVSGSCESTLEAPVDVPTIEILSMPKIGGAQLTSDSSTKALPRLLA